MSLLIFEHYDDHIGLFTDTLAVTPSGEIHSYFEKFFVCSDQNMLIGTTGIYELAKRWNIEINTQYATDDIDSLDNYATNRLEQIHKEIDIPTGQTTTIYHFGWSKSDKKFVRYTYRSAENFKSERSLGPGFGVKPQPTSGFFTAPENISEVIMLAEQLKSEQDSSEDPKRVYIGGDLMMTVLNADGTTVEKIHTFNL